MWAVHAAGPVGVGFLLFLFRCAGLFMTAPVFGTRTVPVRVRLALSVAVALTAFVAAGSPAYANWERLSILLPAVLSESLVGIATGLAARFSIDAVSGAAHAAGLTMGIGFSSVIDPLNGANSDGLSQLLTFVTLLVALAAGIHRDAIAWFCRSVIEVPPGSILTVPELTATVIAEAARSVAMAVRMSFPLTAAVFFSYVGIGLIGRSAPQINVANVGFAVALLAGGGAVYFVSPFIAEMAARSARAVLIGA